MNYVTINEIFILQEKIIEKYGGAFGLRDIGLLKSSLAQPRMTFDGKELYSSLAEKAGILGFCLINNHCFIDGNKRIGHAAMEIFLLKNGYEICDEPDHQEKVILAVASGKMSKNEFIKWLGTAIRVIQKDTCKNG